MKFIMQVMVLISTGLMGTIVFPQGNWNERVPMPTARKEIANSTVTLNGKIYVVGGVASNGSITSVLEIYDPATNSWTEGPPLPIAVWRSSAAAANGKIYVFGGYRSLGPFPFNPTNRVFEYDPAGDSWEEKASMPNNRGALTAAELNGNIHVLGGASSSALTIHRVYDPQANDWSSAATIPTPRSGLTAAAYDGKIYVAGGYFLSGGVVPQNALEVYDPATNGWEIKQNMPVARVGIDAVFVQGKMYVFGGTPNTPLSRTLEYDPATDNWEEMASMPSPVSFMGVATLNDSIYVVGGGAVNLNRTDGLNVNRVYLPPGIATAIDPVTGLPTQFELAQNFPNPFNPATTIQYSLPQSTSIELAIYNNRGQAIRTLFSGSQPSGVHFLVWDGKNNRGQDVASGIYIYRLKSGRFLESKKMILIR